MTGDNIHLIALLFSVVMTLLGGVGVWLKVKWNSEGHSKDIEELRRDNDAQAREINELKLASKDFVSRNDLKAELKEVESRLAGGISELKQLIAGLFGGGSTPPRRRAGQ